MERFALRQDISLAADDCLRDASPDSALRPRLRRSCRNAWSAAHNFLLSGLIYTRHSGYNLRQPETACDLDYTHLGRTDDLLGVLDSNMIKLWNDDRILRFLMSSITPGRISDIRWGSEGRRLFLSVERLQTCA